MDTKIKHLQEENTKLQQEVFSLQSRIRELESTIFGGSVQ